MKNAFLGPALGDRDWPSNLNFSRQEAAEMIRAFLRNPAIRAESEAVLQVLIRIFAQAEREHYVDSDNNLVPQASPARPA